MILSNLRAIENPAKKVFVIFILANLLSISKLVYFDLKAGMILSYAMIALFMITYRQYKVNWHLIFFFIYFALEVISILNYFIIPLSRDFFYKNPQIIAQSISFILIPQFFFFLSGTYVGRKADTLKKNLKILIFVNFLLIIIGILLYFSRPGFYLEFQRLLFRDQFNYYSSYFPRLTSYMSSLVVGVVCSSNLILTLEYIRRSLYKIILLCTFTAGSFLSMERGSWVMIIVGLILYKIGGMSFNNLIIKRPVLSRKSINFFFVIMALFIAAIIFVSNNLIFEKFITELGHKLLSFFNAVSERSETWKSAAGLSVKYPFGLGMGLLSHKGVQNNFMNSVADGNYFRILGDIGFPGLIAFLMLLCVGFFLLYKRQLLSLMIVLVIYSMQAIGTNVFDLYYISFMFWFILGIAYSTPGKQTEEYKSQIEHANFTY